ncbi:MAG: hypothetical protein ACI8W3_002344 [Myxococcota bacterium]|jgi:hypothetical protein
MTPQSQKHGIATHVRAGLLAISLACVVTVVLASPMALRAASAEPSALAVAVIDAYGPPEALPQPMSRLRTLARATAPAPAERAVNRAPLIMEISSSTFQLSVRDPSSGEHGPTIRVALGSPGTATPTGKFQLERVILSPSWQPGVMAKKTGAQPEPASLSTPMGAVKIPFASNGVIAVHGGGDDRALGKPISAGCVRATDADLLRVVAWLDGRDALNTARQTSNGEIHRTFQRPIELVVR